MHNNRLNPATSTQHTNTHLLNMPSISTQTTTFLPKVIPVLQKKALGKRFMSSITRIHKSAIKRNNSWSHERVKNKRILLSIVRAMTKNIRKETAEKAKNLQETLRNKKAFYGVVKEMTLLIRKRNTEVHKAEIKVKKAEREVKKAQKEAKKVEKVALKADKRVQIAEKKALATEKKAQRPMKKTKLIVNDATSIVVDQCIVLE